MSILSLRVLVFGIVTVASQLTTDPLSTDDENDIRININGTDDSIPITIVTELSEESTIPNESELDTPSTQDTDITTEITTITISETSRPMSVDSRPSVNSSQNVCPKVMFKQTLVKCKCGGDDILSESNQCVPYLEGTVIDAESQQTPTSCYNVITRDVNCDAESHRLLNFTKGQFHLRNRGDIVLQKTAGDLEGQRITDYCVIHQLDDNDNLTWMIKGCIPVPSVPRCCPPGKAMTEGSCQPATTPYNMTPPIAADPFGNTGVEWPKITNYLNSLNCTSDPLKTYPLSCHAGSHLLSLARGLAYGWYPPETVTKASYEFSPDFCVDEIKNPYGPASYFISLCYSNPQDHHDQSCADGPCLRKCCREGQVIDAQGAHCTNRSDLSFDPPIATNISHYNSVIGFPLCKPYRKVNKTIHIDENGNLLYDDKEYPPTDYCADTFIYDNGSIVQSAFVFITVTPSVWDDARLILFPLCYSISILFLSVTIACHLFVPEMMKHGGVPELSHAISLTLAYFANFCNLVFHDYVKLPSSSCNLVCHENTSSSLCFIFAIVMQFGYLGAFFWLNVLSFDLWRKTRSLKLFMCDYKMRPFKSFPTWRYMLYAFGIPSLICMIAVTMEFVAPDDVPGLIKPAIGVTKCWFKGDIELLIYFYGPIAFLLVCNIVFVVLTIWDHRQLMKKHNENTNYLRNKGQADAGVTKVAPDARPTRITNHVPDFTQKVRLFAMIAFCWVTEVLSWKIPPMEIWAVTDIINCLQGVLLFVILLGNRNKRRLLKKKFPKVFEVAGLLKNVPNKIKTQLCGREDSARKASSSSLFSNISGALTLSSLAFSSQISNSTCTIETDAITTENDVVTTENDAITTENDVVTTENDVVTTE